MRVCDAVQYAHQHLIVHRDIKASNILVTRDGTPKLLDFGIAKLLEGGGTGVRPPTSRWPMRACSRRAMRVRSRCAARPITTASDIYSLGVLLYELLSGQPPYKIQATTPHALERAICETDACAAEPLRPATQG